MGVLNVTPDSFSDGGRYADLDAAVAHGVRLRADGADLIDVGGESTRPGADRVDAATETARVLPVVRELSAAGIRSASTPAGPGSPRRPSPPARTVVNDVSGGLADPDMARVVRDAGCPWVLMHWRGHSREMRDLATYTDVVAEVRDELAGGSTPRSPPGWPPTGSSSTRAWASPRPPRTTGRSAPACPSWSTWASRCCSGPAASPTWAGCSPTRPASPRPDRRAGGRHSRDERARRRGRRLGGTRARRPRHRRRARRLAGHRQPPARHRDRPTARDRVADGSHRRRAADGSGDRRHPAAEAATGTSGGDR